MTPIVQISLDLISIPEALETAHMALRAGVDSLRANINETFLAAQIREQGEKEMIHDRRSEGCFGRAGFTGF
jgi:hypothetical protein